MELDRTWPEWHPDQALKAEHLIGLEDYLLARSNMIDGQVHGIEDFNWRDSLEIERVDHVLRVGVRNLWGVTPAGEPVHFAPNQLIDKAVPVPALERRVGGNAHAPISVVLELWVDVNERAPVLEGSSVQAADSTTPPQKQELKVFILAESDPIAARAGDLRHSLFLGRYRWSPLSAGSYAGVSLVAPPVVRRFGALKPADDVWYEWTKPLQSRIEDLLAQAEQAGPHTPASMTLVMELSRAAFGWSTTPLSVLTTQLRFINWLSRRMAGDERREIATPPGFPPRHSGGGELPRYCADLLPKAIQAVVVPVGESTLARTVRILVDALILNDVDYRAPIGLLQRWATEVNGIRSLGRAPRLVNAVRDQLIRELQEIAPLGPRASWARAVVVATAAAAETFTGQPLPREVLQRHGASSPAVIDAARILGDLYRSEAQARRAGPLAFYWIARTVVDIPQLVQQVPKDLQTYFAGLATPTGAAAKKGPGMPSLAAPRADRAWNYLRSQETASREKPNPVSPFNWIAAGPSRGVQAAASGARATAQRRTQPIAPSKIKMLVVGPTNAGKRALVAELAQAFADPRVAGVSDARLGPSAERDGLSISEGEITLYGTTVPLITVIASDARLAHPSPELSDPQLVVVVVDPETLVASTASQSVDELSRSTQAFLRNNPSALIALAFSKADEYGVVSPQALRLVNEHQATFLRDVIGGKKAGWEKFASAGSVSSLQSRSLVGSVVGRGNLTDAADWSPTRAFLLEKTKPFWESVAAVRDPSPLVNAYFIAAKPVDPRFGAVEGRGCLHLFVDLLGRLEKQV